MIVAVTRTGLPGGTVTFLFTDVEGSTKLLHALGAERYAAMLAAHRTVVREACARHGGAEVDTQGDAFFVAFPTASGAARAAEEITDGLHAGPIRVRIGLHTGQPFLTDEGYVGEDVHLAARIAATAHGGQVVLSKATDDQMDAAIGLTDLGEHRLKDIEGPIQILQLGHAQFPPLKSISNTNLPRPPSSFVGRQVELALVSRKLGNGARLLTLLGPGGSGKTRLAIEAASEMIGHFRAGVFWTDLTQLRDAGLVMPAIAETIGANGDLAAAIGAREMLLVVDNLEQVISAAPSLATLLSACPNLVLLVTSRERLRVAGEIVVDVRPLAEQDAVALFSERAQLPASAEIAHLCMRLEALPLAIELAAAQTSVMPPSRILARLTERLDVLQGGRDADPRQRTLRAAIEWSHDLLDSDEQRVFRCLGAFVGGSTLEAAEVVCDSDVEVIASLVDKSLVQFDGVRYTMLETIREFAVERLAATSDSLPELRHATWYAEMAERIAVERGRQGRGTSAVAELETDRANLRAAVEWSLERGQPTIAVRILAAARDMFMRISHRWLRDQLQKSLATGIDDPGLLMRGEAALSFASYRLRDLADADRAGHRALSLAIRLGDEAGAALAHNYLANSANARHEFGVAREHLEGALRASLATGDHAGAAMALGNLSDVALSAGDDELALQLTARAIEEGGSNGDPHHRGDILLNRATAGARLGQFDVAECAAHEALLIGQRLKDNLTLEVGLRVLALVAIRQGDARRAATLMGVVERLHAAAGDDFEPTEAALHEEVTRELAAVDRSMVVAEMEAGRALGLEDAMALVDGLGAPAGAQPGANLADEPFA